MQTQAPERLELGGRSSIAYRIQPAESAPIAVLELVGKAHNIVLTSFDADFEFLKGAARGLEL